MVNKQPAVRDYFVDEAGDPNIFSARGQIIIGTQGCSRYFILGVLDIANPIGLANDINNLRAHLLADPYFRNIPSMQPERKKTALAFHAKDDIPEVRREVYTLLRSHDLRFYAVVRDKRKVVDYIRQMNATHPEYRFNPNELYDYIVRRLFRDRLHKDSQYNINFAKRGKADRTTALIEALEKARQNFYKRWGIMGKGPMDVYPQSIRESPGLQAVDYFLWALQRLYERREERYLIYLWPAFHLVHDTDDTRKAKYGAYYTQKTPLTLAALEGLPGI